MTGCDHKFVDSKVCLKCGWQPPPRQPQPNLEQLLDLQNRLNALVETGELGVALSREEVCLISWALGTVSATLIPRRRDRPRPDPDDEPEPTWTERSLHQALDMLMAEYIRETGKKPSETTVRELVMWSGARLERKGGA